MKKHPSAFVSPDAVIGVGSQLWHHVQIREGAILGANCILGKGVYVDAGVRIGSNCKLQNGVYVYAPAIIEDGVFLGPGVILTNDRHPRAINPDGTLQGEADWEKEGVTIRSGASVGAGAVILPSVTLGAWSMVGAGSVVTKDVPDHGLVVGNPAQFVGYVCKCGRRMEEQSGKYHCPICHSVYKGPHP